MKTYSQSMQEDLEPIESNRFSEEQKKESVDIDDKSKRTKKHNKS